MRRTDLDALVADMQAALEDKDFRTIFDRPVIKTTYASADDQEVDETSAHPAEAVFQTLLASSETLDSLGLSKSAERVLLAAQTLQTEAKKKEDDDEEEDESDADDKDKAKGKEKDKKKNDPKEGKKFKEFMKEDPFKDGPKEGPKAKK